jgi:hypothetical protein
MAVPYLKVQVNGNVIRVTYGKGRPGTMGREIDKYIEEYRTTKTGLRLVRGPVKLPPQ